MDKRKMELSEKEYLELAEKLDAEQVILEETDLTKNSKRELQITLFLIRIFQKMIMLLSNGMKHIWILMRC